MAKCGMVGNMQLIVGLGNPGPKYTNTRHNVGFMIVDAIAERTRIRLSDHNAGAGQLSKLKALFGHSKLAIAGKGSYAGHAFTLMKPLTHMNRSGVAIAHYVRALKLDLRDLLVIFDDISLPLGTIRLRKKGGAGGHNGMQDIIDQLGTSDFPRLRVGIGSDFARGQQVDYVLSPFVESEKPDLEDAMTQARDAVLTLLREGLDIAMNRFNRRG
jgi:PTH1 family peptidyl-tRNA hydrolase